LRRKKPDGFFCSHLSEGKKKGKPLPLLREGCANQTTLFFIFFLYILSCPLSFPSLLFSLPRRPNTITKLYTCLSIYTPLLYLYTLLYTMSFSLSILATTYHVLAVLVTGALIYGVLRIEELVGQAALVVALALVANTW